MALFLNWRNMFISLNGEIVLPHIQIFETELQGLSVDSVFID